MALRARTRLAQCYHCRHRFDVPVRAESTSCPKCSKRLVVGDLVIKTLFGPAKELRTCGSLRITPRGRVIANVIEAHRGVDCQGVIESDSLLSGAPVLLGPKSRFKGRLTAPALLIKPGARLRSGGIETPSDPLALADLIADEQG